jgi:4-hydroxybenzoate polyprenyltransferase
VLQYLFLAGIGISLALAINIPLLVVSLVFLGMGVLYNVPPLRTKDYPYLDVLSESFNNPIRFLFGWFAINSYLLPPSSILLAYWMGGAYLMAVKRYSEYRRIGDPDRAKLYRKSFAAYSEKSLLLSAFFYAICAAFFIGIFLIKYKSEFVIMVPLFAALFTWYLWIGFKPESAAQAPETLYQEHYFMLFAAIVFILSIALFYANIPLLALLTDTKLISIRNLK